MHTYIRTYIHIHTLIRMNTQAKSLSLVDRLMARYRGSMYAYMYLVCILYVYVCMYLYTVCNIYKYMYIYIY